MDLPKAIMSGKIPFHVEVIIGFYKGEPMENCQGLQSVGLFVK